MAETIAGTPFGKYTLVRRIAHGGMAELFLAYQEGVGGFRKEVAIKRILPHLADSPDFVAMLLNEARLAAMLSHPAVVHIYELGEQDGSPFIAMEYVPGVTLRQLLFAGKGVGQPMPARLAAAICARVAEGLHHAHGLKDETGQPVGLVHRDVSLENILVRDDGQVKLLDFGIAKANAWSPLTRTASLKGKYAYMAPEQVLGETLDGRADIFGLGVVLFCLLTGQHPFAGENEGATLSRILKGKHDAVRDLRPDTPPALERIVHRSLARKRSARYRDAGAMRDALQAFLGASGPAVEAGELAAYVAGLQDAPTLDFDAGGERPEAAARARRRQRRRAQARVAMGGLALVGGLLLLFLLRTRQGAGEAAPKVTSPVGEERAGQASGGAKASPLPVALPAKAPLPHPEAHNGIPGDEDRRRARHPHLGQVALSTEPATQVFRGEKLLCHTPCQLSLPAGQLPLSFRRVDLGLNKTVRLTVPSGRALAWTRAFGKGALQVTAPEGAGVYVDGKRRGTAPIPPIPLYEGAHLLRVVDVSRGQDTVERLELEPDQELRKTVTFPAP